MFKRQLSPHLSNSFFLFGPRQTGKSTYVKSILGRHDLYVDLLPQRNFFRYAKNPGQFRGEVLAHQKKHHTFTCVIDEIQKIPSLLDEVHELIESTDIRFILTGSSSRKLRRGSANLLAGGAYTYQLFPTKQYNNITRSLKILSWPLNYRPGKQVQENDSSLTLVITCLIRE